MSSTSFLLQVALQKSNNALKIVAMLHLEKKRNTKFVAGLAGTTFLIANCALPEPPPDENYTVGEACVAFSYGALRERVEDRVPTTAEAIGKVTTFAWQTLNGYGATPPDTIIKRLHGTDSAGHTISLEEFGKQIDGFFNEQHYGLGPSGPVADDRIGLGINFASGVVMPTPFVVPFDIKEQGQGQMPLSQIDCNANAST